MLVKLRSAAPLPDFQLLVQFADGASKRYDVSRLFDDHPAFCSLQTTPGLFEQVQADPGGYGVSWNDDLDLEAGELWANGVPAAMPFDRLLALSDATAI